jgi:hypothetical protein
MARPIVGAMPTHPNFKRDLGKSDETTFRYVFHQPNDPNREILLTVMVFDVPAGKEGGGADDLASRDEINKPTNVRGPGPI